MSIGENLRKIRKEMGMRQVDVANDMEISQSYISSVECGKTMPTPRFVKLFCLLYKADENSIVETE